MSSTESSSTDSTDPLVETETARGAAAGLLLTTIIEAVAAAAALWLTPGDGVIAVLVDAAILVVASVVVGLLWLALGFAFLASRVGDTVQTAVEEVRGRNSGNPPPEVAPLKSAERSWPWERPSRARPTNNPHHTGFEGHRYGLGERDAL